MALDDSSNVAARRAGSADNVVFRSSLVALSDPFSAELPTQRRRIEGTSLDLTYHRQNRWGIASPEDPYAHATCLMFGMTPTAEDDRILYLSVHGSDRVDEFAGRYGGISIARVVSSIRESAEELTGFAPFDQARFIVLFSCNACEEFTIGGTSDSRAKRLSQLTGLPVLAPDGLIAVYHRPTSTRPPSIFTVARRAFEAGDAQYKQPGAWKTQSAARLDSQQEAIREKLERFYGELASDAENRVVAQQDGQPANPIQRYVDQQLAARSAATLEREFATEDEIRFID